MTLARKKIGLYQIILDRGNGVYNAGETIRGDVVVEVTESLKIRGIRLRFRGKALVRWQKTDQSGIGITHMSSNQVYMAEENYFDNTVMLTGKEELTLEPNRYRYPFTFKLREGLPTSYEGKYGRIRYSVDSTVDIPWGRDKKTKKPFTVLSCLDLNRYQEIQDEKQEEIRRNLSIWCCVKKQVTVKARLEKIGYVPGEVVRVYAEVTSSSVRVKSSEAQLVQVTRFHAHKQSKFGTASERDETRQSQYAVASLRKTGEDNTSWQGDQIQIPALPPTNRKECKVIDILYRISFIVKLVGTNDEVCVTIPIVLGTVPIRDMFHFLRAQCPDPGNRVVNAAKTRLPLGTPSAAFKESATGKAQMEDTDSDDDSKHTVREYIPAYTFFDWN